MAKTHNVFSRALRMRIILVVLWLVVVVLVVDLFQGCAITDAAGDNVDFTDVRKVIIEPKRIELSGDLEESDYQKVAELHKLVR